MTDLKFNSTLGNYQNIVVVYRDGEGKQYIGNTYYYNGRDNGDDYLTIMYKDSLPDDMGIMMGWNWLDDNSPRITLVPEKTAETGVEDFLYAHGHERDWKSIAYHEVDNYPEIETYLKNRPLGNNEVAAFVISK